MVKGLTFFWSIWASTSFAFDCKTFLSGAVGSRGPATATATFSKTDGLIWFEEGFRDRAGVGAPQFQVVPERRSYRRVKAI